MLANMKPVSNLILLIEKRLIIAGICTVLGLCCVIGHATEHTQQLTCTLESKYVALVHCYTVALLHPRLGTIFYVGIICIP